MVKRSVLSSVLVILGTVAALCSGTQNYFVNPSFEDGLSGWYTENSYCVPTNETAHTGKYSLHCKSPSGASGFVAQWNKVFPGLKHRISGYFKIKKIDPSGQISILAESMGGAQYGIWSYPKCPNGAAPPCMNDWFYFSDITTMYLSPENLTYILDVSGRGDTEF